MRAVQLCIKPGKRAKARIRQLGYPTKNALKHWYREYERGRDLPARFARTKQGYSDEQKQSRHSPIGRRYERNSGQVRAGCRRGPVSGKASERNHLVCAFSLWDDRG
jgi:transposase-like protein